MAKSSFRQVLILNLTAGIGITLSVIASLSVHRWEVSQQRNQFQQQLENLTIALQRSLNRYTDVLTFLNDHYGVSQGQVQQQSFDTFVARSLKEYPGIQALEWAPLVTLAERPLYEKTIQDNGFPTFEITELGAEDRLVTASERDYYLPVTYLAPMAGNEEALGFDLNSSVARAAAIEPAIATGEIHATGRIRLVQEQQNQYGFLVILPLYQTGAIPTSQLSRQDRFSGILLGVFQVSDVVEEALQGLSSDIDFDLYDQNAEASEQFLGRYDAGNRSVGVVENNRPEEQSRRSLFLCPTSADCTRTIEIGQRQWLVAFFPAETYLLNRLYATWATLLTGLLLTVCLALFLRNLQTELNRTITLSDLKLRFFSMASHELRTPLSTILLSTESLQVNYTHLSEDQKRHNLERIHATAEQMNQQITDLLTLTRAEAGKLEFAPELLNVRSFCREVVDEICLGLSQLVELTGAFADNALTAKAFWDKKLVRSLLSNLLSNAAKYSPPTSLITLSLQCDAHRAVLQVCDRGIGIPAADRAHVQETFHRGSNVGEVTGTGLGLAIVKICVDLHRGHWHIDSTEEEGTVVTVTLPLE
ncbi:MAG: CHASE domain-containing protein [Cyanobacteria bacterium P01_D01_bin.156]